MRFILSLALVAFLSLSLAAQVKEVQVGKGWSSNSVNVVKFRKNALTSFGNYQFVAFYDEQARVVVGKRKLSDEDWELKTTSFKGNASDAHNSISIAIDGQGFLHLSWDHHNNQLHYARSKAPLSMEFHEETIMTGAHEGAVTYPEFFRLANGDLIFCYRDGGSGKGNMVLNYYTTELQQWQQLHANLIDGEGRRNAYWQMCADKKGNLHLSWTWRESWLVETNHDICYAYSPDGGKSWKNSKNEIYELPITQESAEIAWRVPQNSNLMNQTAMTTDAHGNPYIANYWNADGITQYKVVYLANGKWKLIDTAMRHRDFSLAGGGTKRIPISRPEIIVGKNIHVIFRDEDQSNLVSMASYRWTKKKWQISKLTETPVGEWEPNIDLDLWREQGKLHIFVQEVSQIDGEGKDNTIQPTMVRVLQVEKANF
ncbi:MAG: BNR repeat-containing protein [Mangrovibacterium sp.]